MSLPGDAQVTFNVPPTPDRRAAVTLCILGSDGEPTEELAYQLTAAEELLLAGLVRVIRQRCGPRSS